MLHSIKLFVGSVLQVSLRAYSASYLRKGYKLPVFTKLRVLAETNCYNFVWINRFTTNKGFLRLDRKQKKRADHTIAVINAKTLFQLYKFCSKSFHFYTRISKIYVTYGKNGQKIAAIPYETENKGNKKLEGIAKGGAGAENI